MSERTQAFLSAFSELEKAINSKFDDVGYVAFSKRVSELARTDTLVYRFKNDIYRYADLRNVLVHNLVDGRFLAEPYTDITRQLESLARKLLSPPMILEHFKVEIREFSSIDSMKTVYTYLHDKDFSQVFFRDSEGALNCLSAITIQRWAAQQVDVGLIDLENTIATVMEYSQGFREVSFVPRNATITDAQKFFGQIEAPFQTAVIVTENGKSTEKPLALVAAWDLGRIEQLISS